MITSRIEPMASSRARHSSLHGRTQDGNPFRGLSALSYPGVQGPRRLCSYAGRSAPLSGPCVSSRSLQVGPAVLSRAKASSRTCRPGADRWRPGQLNAVSVLRELGLGELPVVGLAEARGSTCRSVRPLRLREDSPGIHLLQRAETGPSVCSGYHRQLRDERRHPRWMRLRASARPKRALIKHLAQSKGVREASLAGCRRFRFPGCGSAYL